MSTELFNICVDFGSSLTKIGFTGENCPKGIIPSYVGTLEDQAQNEKKNFVGYESLDFRRDGMKMESICTEGILNNFEHVEAILQYAYSKKLSVNPKDHPILVSEVCHNTSVARDNLMSLLFEKFQVPALYFAKDAVLSTFSIGKQTSLVVDSGAALTKVTPVFEGYTINKGTIYSTCAGDWVSDQLLKTIEERNQKISPSYKYRKVKQSGGEYTISRFSFSKTHPSYERWRVFDILLDLKQTLFRIQENPYQQHQNVPIVDYQLPDQNFVSIGEERFLLGEHFFTPSALLDRQNKTDHCQQAKPVVTGHKSNQDAFHLLAHESLARCEPDIRKELYSNTLLTGGNSLLPGCTKRFEKEFMAMVPFDSPLNPPISTSSLPHIHHQSVWTGGSILGSLSLMQPLWLSKQEYEESGGRNWN